MAIDFNQEINKFNLKEWVSFEGRIPRRTWWMRYVLVILGISIGVQILLAIVAAIDFTGGIVALILSIPVTIIALGLIWPALAGYAKRLHDRDMSAWWILLGFVPVVGGLALLIICGFLPGKPGPNRYGPDPLGGNPMIGAHDQATIIPPRR